MPLIQGLNATRTPDRLLRRSSACTWRAGPSQLGWHVGVAGSDREFPGLPPDRARSGHALPRPVAQEDVGGQTGMLVRRSGMV